jgi:hypothetical protein
MVKVRDERTKTLVMPLKNGTQKEKGSWVPMYQTLVMPLKNGTQKDLELGPDFRRDD